MCDMCKRDLSRVEYEIYTRDGVICLCPNCTAETIGEHKLDLSKGGYCKSEISGQDGAVAVYCQKKEMYFLTPDEAIRLLGKGLMPDEWRTLYVKHGNVFELHGDFYDEAGFAWQPWDRKKYVSNLKEWYNKGTLTDKDKATYNEVLDEMGEV